MTEAHKTRPRDRSDDDESGSGFRIEEDERGAGPAPPLEPPRGRTGITSFPAQQSPTGDAILKAALAHAKKGRPVLPLQWPLSDGRCSCQRSDCDTVGKHPLTLHGLKDASTDREYILAWWTKWPQANLGLITGESSGMPNSGFAGSLEHSLAGDTPGRELKFC